MMVAFASHDTWKSSINMYVPDAQYSAEVGTDGLFEADFGTPATLDVDGILDNQSIAAVATVGSSSFMATYSDAVMGRYGRNITVVASGAATSTVRVDGRDYLGQPMSETFTLAGAVPVNGKKAFARVSQVVILTTTGATTIDLGWGDVLGLPYKTVIVLGHEEDNDSTLAGTFAAPVVTDPGTAITGDPRGTYKMNLACNGARRFRLTGKADRSELYGVAHFAA